MKAPSPFIITTLCDSLMMGKGSYFLECIFYFLDWNLIIPKLPLILKLGNNAF